LIFPINWPEPFGLVMIEAMACGTPVIAFNCGSVPEVMDDGITGFIVNNIDEAVAAVGKIHTLDRARVRATFDRRFTARRMAEDYLDIYEELAQPVRHLHAVPA
jgi:glycosyltransferase involved in cell wall biosynthesis